MARAFRIIRDDRSADSSVEIGTIVYESTKHDYGLASDDTDITGIYHVSVTLNEDGDYPFFTIPFEDLEAV
jgi:hypothetical protein